MATVILIIIVNTQQRIIHFRRFFVKKFNALMVYIIKYAECFQYLK